MILKFLDIKDPILRQKAKKVESIDKKILGLIADMKETLSEADDPEGIGLAAPQVGKSIQLFIVNFEKLNRVIINPKVLSMGEIKKTKKKEKTLEGCLSLPHYYGPIKRPNEVTIEYINENKETRQEKFKGFPAHIIQHEIDHLNGRLFIDHILEQNAPLYLFDGDDFEEVELT
ncbi:peptide deformylase [Candidatus Woesebacteria bacterium RIFCSPHIGHO2_01_FULL_44_21]|uniref:Peptide deformylase n=1 Tax=Candidatus Woesebacteria bacterium RIFCSPHIGHO2_01_FULL_44_21 TaxID=1802503 RepID=A0A1F7YWE9_9BACT|nr:MAG: peptide deformylase [Candidatus Woesebacteria bacterium RIFCSPHIGHO2_01_FULL_44_21]OGM68940.1 MAG: peptide deformylase [Candidatus Woesebacteria bacterium RIFCSPLOWO2_01_FULL_44_24b]